MRLAIFRVMLISLLRDRGAFAMSFILPCAVFIVFAFIFSGATGDALAIRIALSDLRQDSTSQRLAEALFKDDKILRVRAKNLSRDEARGLVRDGVADVGVIVRSGPAPLSAPSADGRPHFEIITDPSREIASAMLSGALQRAYLAILPQQQRPGRLFERSYAVTGGAGFTAVSYYAGAVAVMFMLFSSVTAAATLLDERENGLLERVALGPGGIGVALDGRFAFLVVQGMLQVGVVFATAWLGFGLDLPAHLPLWAGTTLAASMAAAGLALAFVVLCRTKKQAETIGQMAVLIVSAVGGSMVPRFLMPAEVQYLGWLTPNTWALEAYAAVFWRGDSIEALLLPWQVLAGVGLGGLLVAHIYARLRLP